ncbi:MAG TPA: ATP cone domain-containing protein, partial [Candidatus Paceibacterota bacterium]|nr:ATP cone domain-containing protein [Candidatus Paceibacterota bacterium]
MSILIAKADGTSEAFERSKLISSLERAGAKSDIAQNIAQEIEKRLESGTSTHVIYSKAFARLRDFKKAAAARYSLKRAVLEFGPSGFPFESYIGELFKTEGFETRIDQLVRGKCVEHEVDVVITKGEETIYAEAKFHNAAGFKTDLKVVLYVKARIDDIGQGRGLVV